jgi:hypothetical protein
MVCSRQYIGKGLACQGLAGRLHKKNGDPPFLWEEVGRGGFFFVLNFFYR